MRERPSGPRLCNSFAFYATERNKNYLSDCRDINLDVSSSIYIIGLESFSYKVDDPPAPFHGCQFTSGGEVVHPAIPLQGAHRLRLAMSRLETIASKQGLDAFLDTLGPVGSTKRYATVRSWKTASDLLQKSFDASDKEWSFPSSDSDRRNFWKGNVHSLFPSIHVLIMREISMTPTNTVQIIDQSQPGCLFRPTILPVREKSIDDLTVE